MANNNYSPSDSEKDVLRKILHELQDGMEINAGSIEVNAITDEELRATPVPVSGTVTASGPVTDAQLRATAVPVSSSGAVADNAAETQNPIPVAGKAVTTSSYAPAYTAGDRAVFPIDKDTGLILAQANTRKLTLVDDFVSAGGDIAAAATDSGAPIKIGGKAVSSLVAVSANQRCNAHFDVFGRQGVKVMGMDTVSYLSSAARTSTPSVGATQSNQHAKGLWVHINVTAVTSTPDLVVSIEGVEYVAGTAVYTLATTASIATTGLYTIQLYPGLADVATNPNIQKNGTLPASWRMKAVHGNANSITYTVMGSIII